MRYSLSRKALVWLSAGAFSLATVSPCAMAQQDSTAANGAPSAQGNGDQPSAPQASGESSGLLLAEVGAATLLYLFFGGSSDAQQGGGFGGSGTLQAPPPDDPPPPDHSDRGCAWGAVSSGTCQ
jgi:hypothetical protein